MIIKAIQWNIGGGKIRKPEDDPNDGSVYVNDALDSVIETLKKHSPDIITIQECHTDDKSGQAQTIAGALGLKFVANDVYDKSHLEKDQGLSQAIISRFPIENHTFNFFKNPKLELIRPNGEKWICHDKGATSCLLVLPGEKTLNVKTSHAVPFRKFGVDPLGEEMRPIIEDMESKLRPESESFLYQADLNFNDFSVKSFLPGLFEAGVQEVVLDRPTTPKGRKYDHVLFRNLKHLKSVVIEDVLNDHFPIYSEFEISS